MTIELRDLVKKYQSARALDHVSLTIEPGQIVGVLGSNGAGKTTLLRCLATISAPDHGEILCDGVPLRRDDLALRRRMAFLPDFPFLLWDQSIVRNIAVLLRLYEADEDGAEQRVLGLLRDFDLLPIALRPLHSLSRGQLYKAGLVALIATGCDVWLLDEPFASGMDPHGIEMFRHHSRLAASRGGTILYTTQILEIAERFSDRVCVIHAGEVRAFDTMQKLREQARDKANVLEELFRSLREGGA